MQLKQAISAMLLSTAAVALRIPGEEHRGWCATLPDDEYIARLSSLQEMEGREDLGMRETLVVPTYFHAIVNSSVPSSFLSESRLRTQLRVMNERFAPHRIRFELERITRKVDNKLAPGPYGQGVDIGALESYWQRTHGGGYDSVNLYFYSNFPARYYGACTLPGASPPEGDLWKDGCHLASGTIPGGEITNYNLGLTAVHELGHWLGLLHTFEGYSCTGPGDGISDTPQQSRSTQGCPRRTDTCPGEAGDDPIHNYMDYSNDLCYTEFTAGQRLRMLNSYATFREGK
jgi:hypothetical protein